MALGFLGGVYVLFMRPMTGRNAFALLQRRPGHLSPPSIALARAIVGCEFAWAVCTAVVCWRWAYASSGLLRRFVWGRRRTVYWLWPMVWVGVAERSLALADTALTRGREIPPAAIAGWFLEAVRWALPVLAIIWYLSTPEVRGFFPDESATEEELNRRAYGRPKPSPG
jgi:hypothetical protein